MSRCLLYLSIVLLASFNNEGNQYLIKLTILSMQSLPLTITHTPLTLMANQIKEHRSRAFCDLSQKMKQMIIITYLANLDLAIFVIVVGFHEALLEFSKHRVRNNLTNKKTPTITKTIIINNNSPPQCLSSPPTQSLH